MADTLFGSSLARQDEFVVTLSGDEFSSGIELRFLISQLTTIEKLVRLSAEEYKRAGLIDGDFPKFKIIIFIEPGSVIERIKVVYEKPHNALILTAFLAPMLVVTYDKFLDYLVPDYPEREKVVRLVEENEQLRNLCSEMLDPVAKIGGEIEIKTAQTAKRYNREQALIIQSEFGKLAEKEHEVKKNGIFDESKVGTIRKLNLDDSRGNYFGFNIDSGQTGIPTSVSGQFDLNEYRELIDKPVVIAGKFKYVDDKITHLTITSVTQLETIEQLSIEVAKAD